MNTNQGTTLTNQDALFYKHYLPKETLYISESYTPQKIALESWRAATKASEQRMQELEALLAKQLNAIEHAEYLAASAESLLKYLNDMTDEEECVINPDDRYGEHSGTIRNYVYEFRKRAQRARLEK